LTSKLSELNNYNGNFSPLIIKDLLIDFFDDDLIENIEINKFYRKGKRTKLISGIESNANYIIYSIEVKIELNNEYSDKFYKLREDYLRERDKARYRLHENYGHKSLNYGLSNFIIFDKIETTRNIFFSRNRDYFDLFSKALWL
jgi:hypothetical protein